MQLGGSWHQTWALALGLALLAASCRREATADEHAAPMCNGEYADDLSVLSSHARDLERDPRNQYSYCLRTTAIYECVSYGSDGTLRRLHHKVVAHATGFAYRRTAGETYVLTNEHVASWPAVTDEQHGVDDVPPGCKRISESIKIVDSQEDDFEGNDIPLVQVVADPALDAAVLKTRVPLRLLPYRVGRSAVLRVGNLVTVRGFPLGALAATNVGKVVNAYDHDTMRDWDHVDFITDALLSEGHSGSPVLAPSCKSGEYELVGLYHAGYARGSALNVVVGIDQLRDLMFHLRKSTRPADATSDDRLGPAEREQVREACSRPTATPFFPLGPLVAAVRTAAGGALWLEVFSRGFPLRDERLLLVEDLPSASGFGSMGRIYFGNRRGLRRVEAAALDGETQAQVARVVGRLRASVLATIRFRSVDPSTNQGAKRRSQIERSRERQAALDGEAAQTLGDLADRLGPRAGDPVISLGDVLTPTRTAAAKEHQ